MPPVLSKARIKVCRGKSMEGPMKLLYVAYIVLGGAVIYGLVTSENECTVSATDQVKIASGASTSGKGEPARMEAACASFIVKAGVVKAVLGP